MVNTAAEHGYPIPQLSLDRPRTYRKVPVEKRAIY